MEESERKRLKRYGSELNEFIAKNCRQDMTVMNIDLITYDFKTKHIRIIESKHLGEKIGVGQGFLLKVLHGICKLVTGYKIEVFIIRGNPPYDWAYLESVTTGKRKKLKRQEIIDFINYEV